MAEQDNLSPPERTGVEDPGAHDVETSDSEDHFSDAKSAPMSPAPGSPVPRTRVEKVDHEPSHGEVPGTEAHRIREEDAKPDEIGQAPDSTVPSPQQASPASATPPDGLEPPETVVSESAGSTEPHTEEFRERIEETHKADAAPDVVTQEDDEAEGEEKDSSNHIESSKVSANAEDKVTGTDASEPSPDSKPLGSDVSPPSHPVGESIPAGDDTRPEDEAEGEGEGEEEAEDEGDDFDDFEEGGDDDDFDDFEDGFQQAEPTTPISSAPPPAMAPQATVALPFPVPDLDGLDPDDINDTLDPYLHAMFPPEEYETPGLPPISKDQPVFLTARSASLWSQLVAPPPLSPPDWIRSRIRRLFLVSLGVPVDLDEILPASKQKKLVLPSLSLNPSSTASPRTSTDSRSIARLKQSGQNASSTSVDSQGKPSTSKRRKGPPPEPELDLVSAKQVCMTTDEALDGMTDDEIKMHLRTLAELEVQAKEALEYWQKRTDEKIGDRETFEGVIENLVKHARKVRK